MVKQLKVLAMDIDGVLTDGGTILQCSGSELKKICFHDLDAVSLAKRSGLYLALITGEDNECARQIAERFGINDLVCGVKDKAAALKTLSERLGIPLDEICYVGDGDRDVPALGIAGLGIAPRNASRGAQRTARVVVDYNGGQGAVAASVETVLRANAIEMRIGEVSRTVSASFGESLEAVGRLFKDAGFADLIARITLEIGQALRNGGKAMFFGNGGSAAEAQHAAAELVGKFNVDRSPLAAMALTTDSSILTATGNDYSFEDVFSRQVVALAKHGDVAVGISTSGRSKNVVKGLIVARERGLTTVGLVGAAGGPVADCCDLCFKAPSTKTPRIQELHSVVLHSICEIVEREYFS
jgi:D-sedoheptulose 7-phosphate isomerase